MFPVEAWIAIGAGFTALNSIVGFISIWYIRQVKHNTNSMKDALVASTAKASRGQGRDEERLVGEARARKVARKVTEN